jgi:hypothetical protein
MFDQQSNCVLSVSPLPEVLAMRSAYLEAQGYHVVSYQDLEQAQADAMSGRFRVAIIGQGYELRKIKEVIRWIRHKAVRVLLVDGVAPPENFQVDAFLPESHEVEQMVRAVGWLAW